MIDFSYNDEILLSAIFYFLTGALYFIYRFDGRRMLKIDIVMVFVFPISFLTILILRILLVKLFNKTRILFEELNLELKSKIK